MALGYPRQDALPFVIEIDIASVHKAVSSYSDILSSLDPKPIGQEQQDKGWVADCAYSIPFPNYIEDHVYASTHTWFYGLDYRYQNGQFYFYADPATFGWPVVKKTDKEGNLHVYYRVFGFTLKRYVQHPAIAGFYGSDLNSCA